MTWKAGVIGGAVVAVMAASGGAVLLAAGDGERMLTPLEVPATSTVATTTTTTVVGAPTNRPVSPPSSSPAASVPPVSPRPPVSGVPASPSVSIGRSANSGANPVGAVPKTRTTAVSGLVEQVGVLRLSGDDFLLGAVELDLGPSWWLATTSAGVDLDGNGAVGTWWQEMNGLVGRTITVLGDVEDDDIDVFEVNGVALRPLDSPRPPWAGGPHDDKGDRGPHTGHGRGHERRGDAAVPAGALSAEEAGVIALEQIPGALIDVRLDVDDGRATWEVEIMATDGVEYDVEIDAVTGRVLEVERD